MVWRGLQHECSGAMLQAMSKLSRTLCLLWMLLALPLQGMAQASMFACHVSGAAAPAASGAQPMDHSETDHAAMDHSGHGESFGSQSSEQVSSASHGCCNCAPSCAIVILAADQVHFNAAPPPVVLSVLLSQSPISADSRRIDRPPKTHAI